MLVIFLLSDTLIYLKNNPWKTFEEEIRTRGSFSQHYSCTTANAVIMEVNCVTTRVEKLSKTIGENMGQY